MKKHMYILTQLVKRSWDQLNQGITTGNFWDDLDEHRKKSVIKVYVTNYFLDNDDE